MPCQSYFAFFPAGLKSVRGLGCMQIEAMKARVHARKLLRHGAVPHGAEPLQDSRRRGAYLR